MSYINDERYLTGDETAESEKLRKEQKDNFEFYQTESLSIVTSFESYNILAARAFGKSKHGQELFVDCSNNYEFNLWNV